MDSNFAFCVAETAQAMRREFDRRAQALGVTRAQWRVLARLGRQDGLRQVELADALDVEPITLCRMIDRLSDAGLVERRADEEDRRAWRIDLTAKAGPMIESLRALGRDLPRRRARRHCGGGAGEGDGRPGAGCAPMSPAARCGEEGVVKEGAIAAAAGLSRRAGRGAESEEGKAGLLLFAVGAAADPALIGALSLARRPAATVSTDNAYVQQDMISISSEVAGPDRRGRGQGESTGEEGRPALPDRSAALPDRARLRPRRRSPPPGSRSASSRPRAPAPAPTYRAPAPISAFAERALGRQAELLRRGFTTRARYDEAQHSVQEARERLANARAPKRRSSSAALSQRRKRRPARGRRRDRRARQGPARSSADRGPRAGRRLCQPDRAAPGRQRSGSRPASGQPGAQRQASGSTPISRRPTSTGWRPASPPRSGSMPIRARGSRAMSRASGAAPARNSRCFPAQNASGNWVKVTQRVTGPDRDRRRSRPAADRRALGAVSGRHQGAAAAAVPPALAGRMATAAASPSAPAPPPSSAPYRSAGSSMRSSPSP